MNYVDFFAKELREKREARKTTQIELAEKLNMCSRTIIEIENRKSNPRFETVALIAKEMNISLRRTSEGNPKVCNRLFCRKERGRGAKIY